MSALEAGARKVAVGVAPGPAVQHAPAGQQDEVIKALADVAAGLVYRQHNLQIATSASATLASPQHQQPRIRARPQHQLPLVLVMPP